MRGCSRRWSTPEVEAAVRLVEQLREMGMQRKLRELNKALSELTEAQRRLNAVALVHRRLYSGDQISTIDLARYVEELCGEAISSMGREWSQFLSSDLAPVPSPTDKAVIVGLVLTELLINANKYAYGDAPGSIEVRLRENARVCRLVVSDTGTGKTTLGLAKPGGGFGSRMIAGMVGQLGGTLAYEDNQPGLRAILDFPLMRPSACSPSPVAYATRAWGEGCLARVSGCDTPLTATDAGGGPDRAIS